MISQKIKCLTEIFKIGIMGNKSVAIIRCIYDNLGDIATGDAIKNIFGKISILDYSHNGRLNGIDNIMRKSLFRNAILGGGTLIFSGTNTEWFTSLKTLKGKAAMLCTFGTGVRDPEFFTDISSDAIDEWISNMRNFALISVRGDRSRQILKNFGIDNAIVIGDPALFYSRENIKPKRHQQKIGINISTNHQFYGDSKKVTVNSLKELIKVIIKTGWKVTLFPSCKEDLFLSQSLIKEMKSPQVSLYNRYWDVNGFLDAVECQDIFLGIKLHPVILALCAYTPAIMVAYQPKCYDFMETMEMGDFTLRSDQLTADLLKEKVDYMYKDIENIQKRQFLKCKEFRDKQIAFRDKVYKLIKV